MCVAYCVFLVYVYVLMVRIHATSKELNSCDSSMYVSTFASSITERSSTACLAIVKKVVMFKALVTLINKA
jgi:hypothetical protein